MNIPDTKTAVDKEVGEAQKITSMANSQSKDQKKGHPRGTEGAKNSPFCYADGHLSSQECGLGTNISEIQRPGCTPK